MPSSWVFYGITLGPTIDATLLGGPSRALRRVQSEASRTKKAEAVIRSNMLSLYLQSCSAQDHMSATNTAYCSLYSVAAVENCFTPDEQS